MNRHDATTPRKAEEPGDYLDGVAARVVDAAFKVHRSMGPGLLESVYEACMQFELNRMGLNYKCQVHLPIAYEGCLIDANLRIDLIVEKCLIVEIKAVEKLLPLHTAQLLTYLKLTNNNLGLLLNFNTELMRDGVKRVVRTSSRQSS